MIKIGSTKIKNLITELSIEEFEKVSSFINNNELETFERWVSVFVYLGADENEINEMEFSEFKDLVQKFNTSKKKADLKYTKEIELEGYTYRSFEDEFKVSVRDLRYIEKMIKKDNANYMAMMMAILFKRTDLSASEHYADAHVKYKAKLFKKQPAHLVVPFATYIGNKLGETAERAKNEAAEVVE
jgi:hypothetical protein